MGLAGKDHSFQSFRMLGLAGLGYEMNLISSLKEKQGSLCLFNFQDGLKTHHWGPGQLLRKAIMNFLILLFLFSESGM